jgi:hypothetical protein
MIQWLLVAVNLLGHAVDQLVLLQDQSEVL